MSSIDKLTDIFKSFPGIGPRQARRFVYHLLSKNTEEISEFASAVESLRKESRQCGECFGFYLSDGNEGICPVCRDDSRDKSSLMVLAKDVDMETVEKSRVFKGFYFVLGNTLAILEKEPERKIRISELINRMSRQSSTLKEVVLAFNLNPEGEHTAEYVKERIRSMAEQAGIKITLPGRGLSSGAELEYADSKTLENALKNRE
ncbi:MAG: toprim domain-containing protein [bacterium]|nr:toprim domain-containing protein [bacterium]